MVSGLQRPTQERSNWQFYCYAFHLCADGPYNFQSAVVKKYLLLFVCRDHYGGQRDHDRYYCRQGNWPFAHTSNVCWINNEQEDTSNDMLEAFTHPCNGPVCRTCQNMDSLIRANGPLTRMQSTLWGW